MNHVERKGAEPNSGYAVTLPVLAAGMTEAEVIEVHVVVGQTIQRDEPVVTVETEKVQLTVEAPVTGRICEIRVEPGSTVAVGETMMVLEQNP